MNSQFTKIIRIVLGILLIVFGANKFLHFIPIRMVSMEDFLNSFGAAGYIFPVVGVIEVVVGVLLLLKKWIAFALILLAPISINILLFHLFLDVPGIAMSFLITLFNGVLIYKHWPQYRPLFA